MKTNETEVKIFAPKLPDKPTVELALQGIPLTCDVDPDGPHDTPIVFDREHYGKRYCVKDGEVYTIRLGIHSYPDGIGAISGDSSAACVIPTESGTQLHIMAIFSIAELQPAMFMDCVYLSADTPFHLEYVYRSAMLERNNGSKGLVLSDDAVCLKNGLIVVSHYRLEGEIPAFYTYTYDFITVQVKVVFDEKHPADEESDS